METYRLPFGKRTLEFTLPERAGWTVQVLAPRETPAAADPLAAVEQALDLSPLPKPDVAACCVPEQAPASGAFEGRIVQSSVIAVNDKTRPVPHHLLLPPLLRRLEAAGLAPSQITLLIATGTHAPMPADEFSQVIPAEILARYPIFSHDCDDAASLVYLGDTARGTPVWVNRRWHAADQRIVAGNIEPHQFMGFSGGVKSAAVGLTGKVTINTNHAMMTALGAQINHYEDNPCRQDVEEIGRMIGVHYALNAILNDHKQIAHVLAGPPVEVMRQGIPLLRAIYQVTVPVPFDLTIVSPGGHPKDINLYQAQKALAHAAMVTRSGGTIILAAACPEGTGSKGYEAFMADPAMTSHQAVLERYAREGYRIGPHKAWQIARDAVQLRVLFLSEMTPDFARHLLLPPVTSLEEALSLALSDLPSEARIGIMPLANATIPVMRGESGTDGNQGIEGTGGASSFNSPKFP